MGVSYYEIITPTPIDEGDTTASITIRRTGDVSYRERIKFETTSQSALAGIDYQSQDIYVIFQPNQTLAKVDLNIIDDNFTESYETFIAQIGDRFNSYTFTGDRDWGYNNDFRRTADVLTTARQALVTIKDDDEGKPPQIDTGETPQDGGEETNNQPVNRLRFSNEAKFIGDKIILEFNAPLMGTLPDIDRFTVKQTEKARSNKKSNRGRGDRRLELLDVAVNEITNSVEIQVDRNVEIFDSLEISYSDNSFDQITGVVEDQFGNDLKSVSKELVRNSYIGEDMGEIPVATYAKMNRFGEVTVDFSDNITGTDVSNNKFQIVWFKEKGRRSKRIAKRSPSEVEINGSQLNLLFKPIENNALLNAKLVYDGAGKGSRKGDQITDVLEDSFGRDLTRFTVDVEVFG